MSSDLDFGEFEGIQESPIPDDFAAPTEGANSPVQETNGVAEPVQEEQSGVIMPSGRPVNSQRISRPPQSSNSGGGQFAGQAEKRPQIDYNAASQSGARQARTQQVTQGYSQPGQTLQQANQQAAQQAPQQAPQQRRPVQQAPQMAQQVQQFQQMQGQMPSQQPQMPPQQPVGKGKKGAKQPKPPKPPKAPKAPKAKKPMSLVKKILIGVGALVLLILLLVIGKKLFTKEPIEPMMQDYNTSGRCALDTLQSELNNYRPEGIDDVIGTELGDSYLAQEWAYVNNVKIRQEFLQTVGAVVKFQYPQVQQMSTTGVEMTDESGNPIMIESYMNNGEEFMVTIPDYDKLAKTMDEKQDYIRLMLESSKFTEKDYLWVDELTNLMLQFVLDDGDLPTKQVPLTLQVRLDVDGKPYIVDDAALDDLLFGSDDFHYMQAKFSQIIYGWTGYVDEVYLTYERRHNEEYDRWLELFLSYFEADGGKYDPNGDPQFTNVQRAFNRNKSKWEPWYLRDDNNVIQKYPDGTYIVNYFSVKDKDGNDWIQPAAEVEVEVENVRQLEDPWEEERGIWYNWLGMHFLETYTGKGSVITRVGDGSREHPAGIGTTIITKVLCTDGMYHDVKVALMGYWTGQSGIDYAEKFSSRNRGFTTTSVVQLICFEVYVENLENEPIEFLSSEMVLTDRNSNISSRTGTMYGFTETVNLAAHGDKNKLDMTILNDWATSTELEQKYVCWGKSFGRRFNMVYFDCLAGTGNIPTYSAYAQFTGKSSIDSEIQG